MTGYKYRGTEGHDEPDRMWSAPKERRPNAPHHSPLRVSTTSHSTSWANRLTVLASGTQTGSYELFRQVGPEGSGPPPHTHPWDESFYVITARSCSASTTTKRAPCRARSYTCPRERNTGSGSARWRRNALDHIREAASRLFIDLDREISPDEPDFAKLVEISSSAWPGDPRPAGLTQRPDNAWRPRVGGRPEATTGGT